MLRDGGGVQKPPSAKCPITHGDMHVPSSLPRARVRARRGRAVQARGPNRHSCSARSGARTEQAFMRRAVALALEKRRANSGGPFGAVIVRNNTIISEGWNEVTSSNDPTAHAEIVAIRRAFAVLGAFDLPDCDIYTSCEPCPMWSARSIGRGL